MSYKSKEAYHYILKGDKVIDWKKCTYTNNTEFTVKFKGKGDALNTSDKIVGLLSYEFDIPSDDARKVLEDILIKLDKKPTNADSMIVGRIKEATELDKEFLGRFRFTTVKGDKILMFKTSEEAEQYTMIYTKSKNKGEAYTNMLFKFNIYDEYKEQYVKCVADDTLVTELACVRGSYFKAQAEATAKGLSYIEFDAPTFDDYIANTYSMISSSEFYIDGLPKSISNNPDTPCFYHFNPDSLEKGECPLWKEFVKRLGGECSPNHKREYIRIFMDWIYRVFVEDLECDQKMYIRGEGQDGKSSGTQAISSFMGEACITIQSGSLTGKHWGAKVYDKRLVIHADSKNPKPLDNEKSHLNNDELDVEIKYEMSFNHKANYMELYMSNDVPTISDVDNETRRLIYMELGAMTDKQLKTFCKVDEDGELIYEDGKVVKLGNTTYKRDMRDQFPAFLRECKLVYEKGTPESVDVYIPRDIQKEMHKLIIDDASEFEFITTQFITESKDGNITTHDLKTLYERSSLSKEIKNYNSFIRQLKLKFPNMYKTTITDPNNNKIGTWKGIEFESQFAERMLSVKEDVHEERQNQIIWGRKGVRGKKPREY